MNIEQLAIQIVNNPLFWEGIGLLGAFLIARYDKSDKVRNIIKKVGKAIDEKMETPK